MEMTKPTIRELLDTSAVPGDEPWCELAERVEAVLRLHWEDKVQHDSYCGHCIVLWPCATIRALNGEQP